MTEIIKAATTKYHLLNSGSMQESTQHKQSNGGYGDVIVWGRSQHAVGDHSVTAILKQWVKTDVLRIETYKDPRQGRETQVVVVGSWIQREEAGF